jgi:hypothetical protein
MHFDFVRRADVLTAATSVMRPANHLRLGVEADSAYNIEVNRAESAQCANQIVAFVRDATEVVVLVH